MALIANLFSFRANFPALAYVSDADVQTSLNIALLWLDPNRWTVTDFPLALLYWAAHYVTLQQMQLAAVQLGGTGSTDLYISHIRFGERNVAFSQRASAKQIETTLGPGEWMLDETVYGSMFLQLRARNIIPVMIV